MLLWTWLKNLGSYFEAEGCQIVEAQFEKGASLLNPIVRSGPLPPTPTLLDSYFLFQEEHANFQIVYSGGQSIDRGQMNLLW